MCCRSTVLTDLVRSYATSAQSVVPQFLAASFEMLREGQSKIMEQLTAIPNPMASMPGFDALQRQQQAFLKSIMGGIAGSTGAAPEDGAEAPKAKAKASSEDDIAAIKKQLAELQAKLSRAVMPEARGQMTDQPGRITLWAIEGFLAAAEEGTRARRGGGAWARQPRPSASRFPRLKRRWVRRFLTGHSDPCG